jgi:hypothetical protein
MRVMSIIFNILASVKIMSDVKVFERTITIAQMKLMFDH